jgi:tetratricopeptide (TPR) repeat protein
MKMRELKKSALSAEDARAKQAELGLKPDHNCAYDDLLTRWSSSIAFLEQRKCAEKVNDLGELILNNAWLESLENKIRDVNERVEKYREENGMGAILTDDEVILGLLIRTKQDFSLLYRYVKSEFETICNDGSSDALINFLSENLWSVELLSDIGFSLSKIALASSNINILGIIFEQDRKIAEYKMEFLNLVLVQKNLDVINFLVGEGKYSTGEILSILRSEEYYSLSKEIVDVLTKFLSTNGHNAEALYYKAMFLYKSDDFEEAKLLFDEVLSCSESVSAQKQNAQLYKGLCLQYLGQIDDAKAIFESVLKEKDDYLLVTDAVQKSLDLLNNLRSRIELVETLIERWSSGENNLLSKHTESIEQYLQKLKENMEPKTLTAAKNVKQEIDTLLLGIKHISLKQDAPREVVSAQEFEDLPDLHAHMIQGIDEAVLQEYTTAVKEIDYTMTTIGEITEGL